MAETLHLTTVCRAIQSLLCSRSLVWGLDFPAPHCLSMAVPCPAGTARASWSPFSHELCFVASLAWHSACSLPGCGLCWLPPSPAVRLTPGPGSRAGPEQIRACSQNQLTDRWMPPSLFLLCENRSLATLFQETLQRPCALDVASPEIRPGGGL